MEGTRYTDMLRWKDESLVHDVYGYVKDKLVASADFKFALKEPEDM